MNKKNILVDFTFVDKGNFTGVSVYAERLILNMTENANIPYKFILLVTSENADYLKSILPLCEFYKMNTCSSKNSISNMLQRKIKEKIVNSICGKYHISIFFIPYLTIWSAIPQINEIKVVAVLHDLQPLIQNRKFKRYVYKKMLLANLNKCAKIVTISNYVKKELEKYNKKINPSIVHTIYNSIEYVKPKSFHHYLFERKYILNVNAMVDYKNQVSLLKAYINIANKIPHNLVFKGRKTNYWQDKMKPLIEENNLTSRVILLEDNLSTEEMSYLYKNAALFVNPSLMEGFGYTPIEAAIQGTVVLTSSLTALRETTLSLMKYINNPLDVNEIETKICDILNHKRDNQISAEIKDKILAKFSIENQQNAFVYLFNNL